MEHVGGLSGAALVAASTKVHRGAVLPAARFIVIAVPLGALLFYLLVVRRGRGR
ncbi:MAG: hypothetical protein WCA31_02180 [Acidimicrobiales bacterium]